MAQPRSGRRLCWLGCASLSRYDSGPAHAAIRRRRYLWRYLGCTLAAPGPPWGLEPHREREFGSSQDCHYCIAGPPRMRSESPALAPLALRWSTTHSGGCAPPPTAIASHARHPPRRRLLESASGRHPMTRGRYANGARPQMGAGAIRRTLSTWQSLGTREAWRYFTQAREPRVKLAGVKEREESS